ncbi:SREK1 protein, partial [Polypterus senegalus]
MSGIPGTAVIQVTNLSPAVTSEQMRTLFDFLGDIEELRLYPPDNAPLPFTSKVCYIKYREPSSVGVAQHLTNTVFIDRALIVVPCAEGKIPEEAKALSLLAPATTVASLIPGAGLLPIPAPAPLSSLGIPIGTLGALQAGLDPTLAALGGISSQPPLMGNVDPSKIDEIRRTIYVGNLNSQTTTAEQLLEYFKQVGDVKFVRMAGDETQPTRFAFVEFADQDSVPRALAFNGVMFGDRPLKINHSNNAIVKPPELTPQAAAKELEDVMKRVREAQSFISAAIEPETGKSITSSSKKAGRSRSPSPSRSRRKKSHSRSRDKRKDSKSKSTQDILKDRDDRKRKEKKGKTSPKSYSSNRHSRSTSSCLLSLCLDADGAGFELCCAQTQTASVKKRRRNRRVNAGSSDRETRRWVRASGEGPSSGWTEEIPWAAGRAAWESGAEADERTGMEPAAEDFSRQVGGCRRGQEHGRYGDRRGARGECPGCASGPLFLYFTGRSPDGAEADVDRDLPSWSGRSAECSAGGLQ